MKTLATIVLTLSFGLGFAQNSKLTISIEKIKKQTGQVMVGLYNSEANFLDKAVLGKIVKVTGSTIVVEFENVPKGEYAVSLYHDENSNGKLDTGWFGVPSEDYACSNNAKGIMGPPKYSDAKFNLDADKTITIKLN